MSRPRLYLIDGSAYLFRAFHALPPLSNKDGEPTGAMFGVFNMVRAALREKPDYIAFVMDAPGPTFRNEMYPEYKATRPPMPDDLRAQIDPLIEIVEKQGLPLLRVPGVEADDVIGTLAHRAVDAGMDVVISTGDKDLAQLVGPHVTLVNTMTNTTMDEAGVEAKFGVPPARIVDYLTLVGDSVDNVPGVEKCGPKTAVKWLGEFGSLEALMARADEVGGKVGENLRRALDHLPLSRDLVTIRTDCDLDRAPNELKPGAPDVEALRALYHRYEFKSALRDLDAAATADGETIPEPEAVAGEGEYSLVMDQAALDDLIAVLGKAELICVDLETSSIDPMRAEIVGLSFAVEPGRACYLPVAHEYPGAPAQLDRERVLQALKPLLEDDDRAKLGQHIKYDMNVFARHGITLRGIQHDTMLQSYVLNPTANRHDMDTLAEVHLGYRTIRYEEVAGKGAKQIPFAAVGIETARDYAAEDADITLRLHQALWPRLEAEKPLAKVYREIEMPLVPVLAAMERHGVLIDRAQLRAQSQELGKRMHDLSEEAFALIGRRFNLDSPKQLGAILFDELGLPVTVKTPSGAPSTNEEALDALADQHALPRLVLDYRSLAKLKSTYTEKLADQIHPETGRVHTSYHQAVAGTGRLSSSDPNLQNIPIRTEEGRRIRRAFVAPEGHLILAADYSQIELRIMAHISGDEGLLKAFREGQDIHRATAAEVFGLEPDAVGAEHRRAAKAINFGLIYGMSAFGLARQLGIERREAQEYMDRYFDRYPGVQAYMEDTRKRAHRDGYVETLFGRRLYLPDLKARNPNLRQGAERAAINAPMQGTAADIIKRAMIAVARPDVLGDDAVMIMQVHDELVFEVAEEAIDAVRSTVIDTMVAAAELKVPLVVDAGVGPHWDAAH
jgi:DNA polymerase I